MSYIQYMFVCKLTQSPIDGQAPEPLYFTFNADIQGALTSVNAQTMLRVQALDIIKKTFALDELPINLSAAQPFLVNPDEGISLYCSITELFDFVSSLESSYV